MNGTEPKYGTLSEIRERERKIREREKNQKNEADVVEIQSWNAEAGQRWGGGGTRTALTAEHPERVPRDSGLQRMAKGQLIVPE